MEKVTANNPLLSVVMPVYNTERYLQKALDAILNSTFKDFELIIIDDGSTDGSPKICDDFKQAHSERCIKVYHTENKGQSTARNFGFSIARGKYISYCDSDDWVEPELYEELVNAAEKNNAQVAVCGIRYYDETLKTFSYSSDSLLPQSLEGRVFNIHSCGAVTKGLLDCSLCNKVLLKDFLLSNNISWNTDVRFSEDNRYWAKTFCAAERMTLIGKRLYNYRINQGGETNSTRVRKNGYDSFAKTMRIAMEAMIQHDLFQTFKGEYIAYLTMNIIVAWSMIAAERKKAFFNECAGVFADCGHFKSSKEQSLFIRCAIRYAFICFRHLPYWLGSIMLFPLKMLRSQTLKKLLRKITG